MRVGYWIAIAALIIACFVIFSTSGCKVRTIDDGGWDHGYVPEVTQDRHSKEGA